MELDFSARPFRLQLKAGGASRRSTPRDFAPFALPDSLYRAAARKIIAGLLASNARQRTRVAVLEAKLAMLRPRDRRWP